MPLVRVFDNLASVQDRILEAAKRAGRDPRAIVLVAVTKTATAAQAAELIRSGKVRHLGENRVQAAQAKIPEALGLGSFPQGTGPEWHLVGHLQSNKAAKAAALFDWVDALDDLETARRLDRACGASGKRLKVLVQVQPVLNPRQSGLQPEAVGGFLEDARKFKHLEVAGLMAIAPELEPVEAVRPHFRRVKRLFDGFFDPSQQLSMGMSRDFEVAIEEGATMVRIGTLLFQETSNDNVVRRPT